VGCAKRKNQKLISVRSFEAIARARPSRRAISSGAPGLLRCYLSRVENGHTVPSLETLAKIAEAMEIALADFFPGAETPARPATPRKCSEELSEDEIRFLSEIKNIALHFLMAINAWSWP